ncbi:MAG: glycosyltransferase family 4 protein [Flavobacteriia bacterium]|nr:glycosyltransferase family 4 protein [Flavobacteriia bacterium]
MKKVLIITYYWPPSGGSGVQRWLKFVKYFRDFGIEPIVLTVAPEFAALPNIDESLEHEIPVGIEVHKTRAKSPFGFYKKIKKGAVPNSGFAGEGKANLFDNLFRFIRGNFFIPDARIGWNKFALEKARELIQLNAIDTVITSSPPHSTQLIGLQLKKEFNLKWLADLRDPWTEIYYNKLLFRTNWAKKIDYGYEQACLQNADTLIVVSEDIKRRFGEARETILEKIHVIPNGFDEEDSSSEQIKNDAGLKYISYVGNLGLQYPIEEFLKTFSESVKFDPQWRIRFVGNVSDIVNTEIQKLDLEKWVEFIPYVEHKKAVEYMINSDLLLLIIPNTENNKGILTGKLFEYIATGNPIIYIGPEDGDALEILKGNTVYISLNSKEKEAVIDFILNSSSNQLEVNPSSKNTFSRRNLTGEVAKLILE